MKVSIEENSTPPEPRYPFVGRVTNHKQTTLILFSEDRVGVVLVSGSDTYPVGYHSDSWYMDTVVPFRGKITIEV